MAANCRGKERCSRCGQGHNIKSCPNDLTKCTNCGGDHAASSKDCPIYKQKAEIIYIKTINNISYAEACKQGSKLDSATNNYNLPRDLNVSKSNFPPLPKLCDCQTCPVSYRPPPSPSFHRCGADKSPISQPEGGLMHTKQMGNFDFSNFMFGNPLNFIAFLTEVIQQTISFQNSNETVDILKIISDSAEKRMGIPIDMEQLKNLT